MSAQNLDDMQVGEDLGSVEYEITDQEVARFFGGVGDYTFKGEAAKGNRCLPPIMIGNDYLKLYKKKYTTVGALHAKLQMEALGCLRSNEKVTTSGKVLDKFNKRGKTSVIILTSTTDSDGKPIVNFTIKLTYIF
ncbi:MAG: hypothetical protein K9K66_08900 [Desulfarculaceae bacterium]|nr:hypothetical protein [Desulfarculaceae bacterium]MCF8073151.1 hypothetical protein [Desulfarculaceae bacterium]MCF8101764.1 hypothetical protein [Desulfarculaceae bacterium]MCF8118398.1 hypothetical protein [Desulfarculaceae bacterium]